MAVFDLLLNTFPSPVEHNQQKKHHHPLQQKKQLAAVQN
jgi:hypothetical protein